MSENGTAARTVHVRIEGRVQGVWFRGWTVQTAKELGLSGWVRNRRDGSVEVLFSGASDAVARMLKRCEEGPPHARIARVEVTRGRGAVPSGFHVRPTE